MYEGKRIRIGIVDNDTLTAIALKSLIRQALSHSIVVWTERCGEDAIKRCASPHSRPDVLVVDASLEDCAGADVCRAVRRKNSEIVIIGITSFRLGRFHSQMLESGAQCLLPKEDYHGICEAIQNLAQCRVLDNPRYSIETAAMAHQRLKAMDSQPSNPTIKLSAREEEVLNYLVDGKKLREIAIELKTTESTVKTYAQRAYRKLGTSNKALALIKWLKLRAE